MPGLCRLTTCENKSTFRCSRCKIAKYCSKECQATHWENHKIHCTKINPKPAILYEKDLLDDIMKTDKIAIFETPFGEQREKILKRKDSKLYTEKSGIKIATLTPQRLEKLYNQFEKRDVRGNWNKLTKFNGELIRIKGDLYYSVDKQEKRLFIINSKTDNIVKVMNLSMLPNFNEGKGTVVVSVEISNESGMLFKVEEKM